MPTVPMPAGGYRLAQRARRRRAIIVIGDDADPTDAGTPE
jgi:hypothetical protein